MYIYVYIYLIRPKTLTVSTKTVSIYITIYIYIYVCVCTLYVCRYYIYDDDFFGVPTLIIREKLLVNFSTQLSIKRKKE